MNAPRKQDLLSSKWNLRYAPSDKSIAIIVKKSPQYHQDPSPYGSRKSGRTELFPKWAVGHILGDAKGHCEILLDE